MRGWSLGGYLSALAVLRRPDVFHAGIAGAPVTDWRLYDTHYTERYLGDPASNPAAYAVSSVIDDPERAVPTQVRPLLIIHGLADDNVFVAHSLRLSSALLAAGYPHQVLPLSGVTHMTPQEVVAENMLLLQVAFLKRGARDGRNGGVAVRGTGRGDGALRTLSSGDSVGRLSRAKQDDATVPDHRYVSLLTMGGPARRWKRGV